MVASSHCRHGQLTWRAVWSHVHRSKWLTSVLRFPSDLWYQAISDISYFSLEWSWRFPERQHDMQCWLSPKCNCWMLHENLNWLIVFKPIRTRVVKLRRRTPWSAFPEGTRSWDVITAGKLCRNRSQTCNRYKDTFSHNHKVVGQMSLDVSIGDNNLSVLNG